MKYTWYKDDYAAACNNNNPWRRHKHNKLPLLLRLILAVTPCPQTHQYLAYQKDGQYACNDYAEVLHSAQLCPRSAAVTEISA